jgi:hypothetical protein
VVKCRNALQALTLMSVGFAVAGCSKSIALPSALSCSTSDYPSAFDKGMLVFADLAHDGVQSQGVVALAPLTGRTYFGTSSLDKTDRVLTLHDEVNGDGSQDLISGTMRLHLASSEGADRYKLDLTVAGEKGPTRWLCLGPIAQKEYAQKVHAHQANSPAPVVPHIKAGGYICNNSGEVMGERQLRDRGVEITFQGCRQVGADIEVNILGGDAQAGTIKVGNTGGVAWVDEHDLVGK